MTTRFTVDGKKVSLLGYGAMRLPAPDGGHANNWLLDAKKKDIDQPHLNRQVKRMLEAGVNYFDVAPVYCRGEAEESLGTALKASGWNRGDYIIATTKSAYKVFLIWCAGLAVIGVLYYGGVLNRAGLFLISALFYSHKIFDREKMLERGEIYSQEWLDDMMAFTKGKYSAEELRTAWDSIIGDPIPGMKEAMRRAVAKGYRFVFFSNTSAMHMQTFLSRTELAGLVSGAIFSFDVSSMKPDPVIYEEFEKQYGIPGFYFDDNKDNIAAGKARGAAAYQNIRLISHFNSLRLRHS